MSTLKDVAARCGVDISTVSRALRSDPRVKGETRERVDKAARELNYTPNLAARNLVKGRSRTLALIVSSLENPLEQMPAQYASTYLAEREYDLMISLASDPEGKAMERQLTRLEQNVFDGAVIIPGSPFSAKAESILKRLKKKRVPLVFLDRWKGETSFPVVTTDNRRAGAELARVMIENGAEVLLLLSDLRNGVEVARDAGVREGCKARGVSRDPEAIQGAGTLGLITSSYPVALEFLRDNREALSGKTLLIGVFDQWKGHIYPARKVWVLRQDFETMALRACRLILDRLDEGADDDKPVLIPFKEIVCIEE